MAPTLDCEPPAPAASRVMRLLATESSGAILRALAAGPLRSAHLTERLAHHSRRTIYRRLTDLGQLGAVDQRSLATSPPAVVYELTTPAGYALLGVLEQIAANWLGPLNDEFADGPRWGLLALLADGWDSALIQALSKSPRSLTELDDLSDLTYHQMSRRTARLADAGILERVNGDRVTRYTLSEQARLGSVVIAASAHWERRNLLSSSPPLSAADTVALLRSALPLVRLPEHSGSEFVVTVEADPGDADSQRFDSLRVAIEQDGLIQCRERGDLPPDAWVRGSIEAWLFMLLENDCSTLRVGGDRSIVDSHFERLHERTASMTREAW